MKKNALVLLAAALLLASCQPIVPPAPVLPTVPSPVPTVAPTQTPVPPATEITYPIEGARVSQMEVTKGTSQALPEGTVIWIFVFIPHVGRYYPQNNPVDMQVNGEWSAVAYIGQETDSGMKADIVAVIVDKSAQQAIFSYLQNARDTQNFAGLERIPEGALIYDRITVERK